MFGERLRRVGVVVGRDGVVYPAIVTGGAYLVAPFLTATFETLLFVVFAVAAVATGLGAMSGSSSSDALRAGAGLTRTATPGDRWNPATLVRLVVFDVGLAAALSVHAVWWAGAG